MDEKDIKKIIDEEFAKIKERYEKLGTPLNAEGLRNRRESLERQYLGYTIKDSTEYIDNKEERDFYLRKINGDIALLNSQLNKLDIDSRVKSQIWAQTYTITQLHKNYTDNSEIAVNKTQLDTMIQHAQTTLNIAIMEAKKAEANKKRELQNTYAAYLVDVENKINEYNNKIGDLIFIKTTYAIESQLSAIKKMVKYYKKFDQNELFIDKRRFESMFKQLDYLIDKDEEERKRIPEIFAEIEKKFSTYEEDYIQNIKDDNSFKWKIKAELARIQLLLNQHREFVDKYKKVKRLDTDKIDSMFEELDRFIRDAKIEESAKTILDRETQRFKAKHPLAISKFFREDLSKLLRDIHKERQIKNPEIGNSVTEDDFNALLDKPLKEVDIIDTRGNYLNELKKERRLEQKAYLLDVENKYNEYNNKINAMPENMLKGKILNELSTVKNLVDYFKKFNQNELIIDKRRFESIFKQVDYLINKSKKEEVFNPVVDKEIKDIVDEKIKKLEQRTGKKFTSERLRQLKQEMEQSISKIHAHRDAKFKELEVQNMFGFVNFLKLKTKAINGNEIDNYAMLKKNIESYKDEILSSTSIASGQLTRLFNELHGTYPELEVYLELLTEILDLKGNRGNDDEDFISHLDKQLNSGNVLSWYQRLLVFAIQELFDSNGDLLPSIWDELNHQGFMETLMANKTSEEKELIYGQILSSYMINIVGGVAADKFHDNHYALNLIYRFIQTKNRTEKDKEEIRINKATIQQSILTSRINPIIMQIMANYKTKLKNQWEDILNSVNTKAGDNKDSLTLLIKLKKLHQDMFSYMASVGIKEAGQEEIRDFFIALSDFKKIDITEEEAIKYHAILLAISDCTSNPVPLDDIDHTTDDRVSHLWNDQYERIFGSSSQYFLEFLRYAFNFDHKKTNYLQKKAEDKIDYKIANNYFVYLVGENLKDPLNMGKSNLKDLARGIKFDPAGGADIKIVVDGILACPEKAKLILSKPLLTEKFQRNFRRELGENPALIKKLIDKGNDSLLKAIQETQLLESSHIKDDNKNGITRESLKKLFDGRTRKLFTDSINIELSSHQGKIESDLNQPKVENQGSFQRKAIPLAKTLKIAEEFGEKIISGNLNISQSGKIDYRTLKALSSQFKYTGIRKNNSASVSDTNYNTTDLIKDFISFMAPYLTDRQFHNFASALFEYELSTAAEGSPFRNATLAKGIIVYETAKSLQNIPEYVLADKNKLHDYFPPNLEAHFHKYWKEIIVIPAFAERLRENDIGKMNQNLRSFIHFNMIKPIVQDGLDDRQAFMEILSELQSSVDVKAHIENYNPAQYLASLNNQNADQNLALFKEKIMNLEMAKENKLKVSTLQSLVKPKKEKKLSISMEVGLKYFLKHRVFDPTGGEQILENIVGYLIEHPKKAMLILDRPIVGIAQRNLRKKLAKSPELIKMLITMGNEDLLKAIHKSKLLYSSHIDEARRKEFIDLFNEHYKPSSSKDSDRNIELKDVLIEGKSSRKVNVSINKKEDALLKTAHKGKNNPHL